MNTKRYTLSDAHSTQFYQLPKWLVALRVEAEISNEAILLYTYLRDRVQLSITNKSTITVKLTSTLSVSKWKNCLGAKRIKCKKLLRSSNP